ncbi:hypothetical protein CF328_g7690 [Tilletia controversa]|nr:hypothetical protein CF328_g7690 [Tilletia controversa]
MESDVEDFDEEGSLHGFTYSSSDSNNGTQPMMQRGVGGESDADELEHEAKAGSLGLDPVVHLNQGPKRQNSTARAGAPAKVKKLPRQIIELNDKTTFLSFKIAVQSQLDDAAKAYNVGPVKFNDLKLAVKVPKGRNRWRQPIEIKTAGD